MTGQTQQQQQLISPCHSQYLPPLRKKTRGQRGDINRSGQLYSSGLPCSTSFSTQPLPPHQMFIPGTWSKPLDPGWPREHSPTLPCPAGPATARPGERGGSTRILVPGESWGSAFLPHLAPLALNHWSGMRLRGEEL